MKKYTLLSWLQKKLRRTPRKFFTYTGAVVLSITIWAVFTFLSKPAAVAAWFDYNWAYRVIYVLTNSGSAVASERKILVEVDTSSLITAGKLQSDCDDARFTDQDGKLLEYFIDTASGACNTNSTDFYVKVSTVPANKFSLYFYYGNPSAPQGRSADFFAVDTLGQSLKAYWKLDESTANTCVGGSNDACNSGILSDGAWNNNVAGTTGKIGSAASFDGTDDFIQISGLLNSPSTLTISAWAKMSATDSSGAEILTLGDYALVRFESTGYLSGHYYNGTTWNTITKSTNYKDGNWHHYVYVINPSASTQKLYVDGTEAASGTSNAAIVYTGQGTNTFIGKHGNGSATYDFNGQIDDVRVYNRALSVGEVGLIYNAGNPAALNTPLTFTPSATSAQTEEKSPGPIGNWKLDEGSGATIYDNTQQANHGAYLTGVPISTGLSQQVELLSKNFTTTSTTYAPSDNSLGLMQYDSSKYTSPTAFFEAVIKQSQTNTTSNDVGRTTAIDCPAADDCKIIYFDFDVSAIRLMDCDNATCSSGTITILDGYTGCAITGCDANINSGEYLSIDCVTATDCKIAYYSGTNSSLFLIDCDNATCSSGTRTLLDGTAGCSLTTCGNRVIGLYVDIDCVGGGSDCKIAYLASVGDTYFADCDNATCSSGTTRMVDGGSSCPLTGCNTSISIVAYLDLTCLSVTDCKIAYFNDTNDDLMFIDCDTSTCTTGTSSAIDGISGCPLTGCSTTDAVGYNISLDCVATDDCKIGYYNSTDTDLYFADCNNATCTSGTTTLIEGNTGCALTSCITSGSSGGFISVYCGGGSDDCKIGFFRTTSDDLRFADCSNAACSSGSVVVVDGGSGCGLTGCSTSTQAGNYLTMFCASATDCKIVHNEAVSDDVYFADCDNAGCSTGTARVLDGNGAKESDVGSFMDMDCSAGADNCKIAYYDVTETALAFFDCDDVNCTTGTLVYLDGVVNCALTGCSTSADAGSHVKIDCSAGGNDCKIAYNNSTTGDMYFADCNSQTCNVGSRQLIDGNTGCSLTGCVNSGIGLYSDIDCSAGPTDCKIVYKNFTTDDLIFADCDTATCSSGTRTMLDGNTSCALTGCSTTNDTGSYPSLDCQTATDCKIAYTDNALTALKFADCDNATCSSGTITIVDGSAGCGVTGCVTGNNSGQFPSLDCSAGVTDCKIAHYNQTGADLYFADCDNATCSTGTANLVDGSVGCPVTGCSTSVVANYPSLYCGGNSTDCKIGYFRSYDFGFIDCDSTSCNTGTISNIDAVGGCTLTGCSSTRTYDTMFALDCSNGATDCKVAGYESTTLDVNFANCDTATCSAGNITAADTGSDRIWVQLMSSSGTPVPDGIISSKATNYTRFRTAAISPTTATNYGIRVASSDATNITADVMSSRLIVNQTGSPTATQTSVEVGSNETSTATSYTQLTNKKIYHFDTNKFTPTPTVYFEATLANTTAGQTAYAALYTDGASCSSVVSGSEVTVTGTTWTRVRSSAITLTDDADYMVCIKTSANTAQIANARIILDQSSTLYATELVYNLINTAKTDTDSTYTSQSGLNYFDPSYFSDSTTYYYESDTKTSAGTGYSQLYNSTDATAISSSEVNTSGTSYSRQRSSALTMPATAKTLDTQIKNSATNTTTVSSADLIIQAGAPPNSNPTRHTSNDCYSKNCIEFNGSDNAVKITNTPVLDLDQGLAAGMTFAAWVKVSSDGENSVGQIIAKGEYTYLRTTNEGSDRLVDLEASFDLASSDATVSIVNALPLNEWHYVVMGYTDDSDDEISVYIDGRLKGTSTNGSGAPASDSNDWILGGNTTANYHGLMDEVSLYAYERTAAQLALDINAKGSTEGVNAQIGDSNLPTALNQGLVAYYPMDETVANSCANGTNDSCDKSGNSNDAAWNNGTAVATGRYASATSYDGSDDYTVTADSDSLDPTSNWTVSGWIYNTNTDLNHAWQYLVMKGTGYGQQNIPYFVRVGYGQLSAGNITNYTEDSDAVSISSLTAVNTWMHFTVVFNDQEDTMSLYVNGQLQTTAANTQASLANATGVGIGATANGGNPFKGSLDELRIYNRALNADEVRALSTTAPAPVAYYKFDENTGTTAKDESGRENTATINNGALWEPGKYGSAVRLDGTNDDITAPSSSSLNIGSTDFTLMAWIKGNSMANGDVILGKTNGGSAAADYGFHFSVFDSIYPTLHFATSGTALTKIQGTTALTDGQWYHVAVVVDRDSDTNTKFYLNGVPITTTVSNLSTNTGAITNTAQLAIGNESDGGYNWDGSIDEVKIYNYARSQSEILQDMNAGAPPSGIGLQKPVMHLSFDDGTGTTAQDSSTNNNDGTLTNMAAPATSTSGWSNDGKFGKAISFDGNNDYVTTALGWQDSGSMSVWVYPTSTGTDWVSPIGWKYAPSSGGYTLIDVGSGTKRWRAVFRPGSASEVAITGSPVLINTWQHVLMTWSQDNSIYTVTLFVNGVKQGTTTWAGTPTLNSIGPLYIGTAGQSANNNFTGRIDEAKVYPYALSEAEAKLEYNRGAALVGGAISTASNGTTPDTSSARGYCIPGDTTSCSAPVAEWKLDENTGSSAADTSGNANTGTLQNSPTWSPGKMGSALTFNGSNQYITVGSGMSQPNSLTIGAWFKTTATNTAILGQSATQIAGSPLAYVPVFSILPTGTLRAEIWNGTTSGITTTQTVNDGKWHYAVITATGSTQSLYLDGQLIGSRSGTIDNSWWTYTQIGAGYSDNTRGTTGGTAWKYFSGSIDQVTIYNYARTPAQIAWEYNRGAPVAWYKLDECQGTTAYNSVLNSNGEAAGNNGTVSIGGSGSNTAAGSCKGTSGEAWKDGASGKVNSSLELDGTDDYVSVADTDTLDITGDISVAVWVKPSTIDGAAHIILGKGNQSSTATRQYSMRLNANNRWQVFAYSGSSTYSSEDPTTVPSTSRWDHLVLVRNKAAGTLKIYTNGVLTKTATGATGDLNTTSEIFAIGREGASSGNQFAGQVDDLRIYNYALTDLQVKDIYTGGAVRFN